MRRNEKKLKELALAWKKAAPKLRAVRHADIRRQDNARAIDSLNSLFRRVIKERTPRRSCGFVKMYEALRRQSNG